MLNYYSIHVINSKACLSGGAIIAKTIILASVYPLLQNTLSQILRQAHARAGSRASLTAKMIRITHVYHRLQQLSRGETYGFPPQLIIEEE